MTPLPLQSELTAVAQAYFRVLRAQQPTWTIEDLCRSLGIEVSQGIAAIASDAGFRVREEPANDEILRVAKVVLQGVSSPHIIAQESQVSEQRVRQILDLHGGYGTAPYGQAPYGGSRKFSDGTSAVPRQVTIQGQLSYRGKLYSLGLAYRGRKCEVRERGDQLLVTFADRRPLYLTKRPEKTA